MFELKKYGDKVAFIDEKNNSITYNSLDRYATIFNNLISNKSLVFTLCSNTIDSILGYVALYNSGNVQLLLDKNIESSLFNNLLFLYKPKYIWLPKKRLDLVSGQVIFSTNNYVLVCFQESINIDLNHSLSLLIATSGSTGSPKLVRLSYKNLESNAESIIDYLKIDGMERPITTLPFSYSYGLSVINSHLIAGATILLIDKSIMQKEFWKFIDVQKATSLSGVPYTYEMLYKLGFFKRKLPYLKTLTQAGGKLSSQLQTKFAEYSKLNNKRFFVMYGQSEATARISYLPNEKCLDKIGSIGIPISGGKLYLVDDNSNIINSPFIQGELFYSGPNVSMGYANSYEDLNLGECNNEIINTGDIALYDEEGYFYIKGRKKRFIKIFGNRISLDETESLLKTRFLNIDFACTGIDDLLHVYTTKKDLFIEIKSYLQNVTHLNPIAFKIYYLDKIPKNSSGKVLYQELKKYE